MLVVSGIVREATNYLVFQEHTRVYRALKILALFFMCLCILAFPIVVAFVGEWAFSLESTMVSLIVLILGFVIIACSSVGMKHWFAREKSTS